MKKHAPFRSWKSPNLCMARLSFFPWIPSLPSLLATSFRSDKVVFCGTFFLFIKERWHLRKEFQKIHQWILLVLFLNWCFVLDVLWKSLKKIRGRGVEANKFFACLVIFCLQWLSLIWFQHVSGHHNSNLYSYHSFFWPIHSPYNFPQSSISSHPWEINSFIWFEKMN